MSKDTKQPLIRCYQKKSFHKLCKILKNLSCLIVLILSMPIHAGVIGCDTTEPHAKYIKQGLIIATASFSPPLNARLRVYNEGYEYPYGLISDYYVKRNGSSNLDLISHKGLYPLQLTKNFLSGQWHLKRWGKHVGMTP